MAALRVIHTRAEFLGRVVRFTLFGIGFLALTLGVGTLGYRGFAGLGRQPAGTRRWS